MDQLQENGHLLFNVLMGLIAGAASIISWFTKNHYQNIDKKLQELEGGEKILTQKIHEIIIIQARSESLVNTIVELKGEIKELRELVQELRVIMNHSSHPNIPNFRPRS